MTDSEFLNERRNLALAKISVIEEEMIKDDRMNAAMKKYFTELSLWLLQQEHSRSWSLCHTYKDRTILEWQDFNRKIYAPVRENYAQSFANPGYACEMLGKEIGRYLSFVASEIYQSYAQVMLGHEELQVILMELFLEIYTAYIFAEDERIAVDPKELRKIIYWCVNDYTESFVEWRIRQQLQPDFSPLRRYITEADVDDLRYLYRFGFFVSDVELQTAAYLQQLPEASIEEIADTFVEGYFRGFEVNRIPLGDRCYVTVRGAFGFERVFKSVIQKFRDKGFEPVFMPADTTLINRKQVKIGYFGKSANEQFEFDHSKDLGLFYDKPLAKRHLEALKRAYEICASEARLNAGPACFETFGERPFEPKLKEQSSVMSEKQKKIQAEYLNLQAEVINEYMDYSKISFTIIAFPTPEIGEHYREIFEGILRVNTLDNAMYRRVQQTIVDQLDQGKYVYVRGKYPNRTAIKVQLYPLKDPERETIFENCCADVNIPLGEVFTSPVLKGTEGILHATGVYLKGIYFKNLILRFADGCIVDYQCDNLEDEAANRRLIKDELLGGRDSLPIGEFAIGTNTTAYALAKKYKIIDRLPILIVEKTGPHFAIGDTCYARAEAHKVYNPDGKEIVARENEISAKRDEEDVEAYFNCHTDITIPYDEISEIIVVDAEENMVSIISDGRFTLAGTEILNEALNNE